MANKYFSMSTKELVSSRAKGAKAELKRRRKNPRNELMDFKITMTVRLPARSVEHVFNSIQEGMDFDEDIGEGILHYKIQELP
jgi:hypothetical protein